MSYQAFDGELDKPTFTPFSGELDDEQSSLSKAWDFTKEAVLGIKPEKPLVAESTAIPDPQLDPELNRQTMLKSGSPDSVMFNAGRAKAKSDAAVERGAKIEKMAQDSGRTVPDFVAAVQESDQRKKFANENPVLGGVASSMAGSLAGIINSPAASADFFNKVVVNPVLNAVGADSMARVGNMPGVDSLQKTASDYSPDITQLPLAQAYDKGVTGEWLVAQMAQNSSSMALSLAAAFAPPLRAMLLPSMGAMSGGQAYAHGDDSRVAAAKGTLEAVTEMLPLGIFDKLAKMPLSASKTILADAGKRLLATGGSITAQHLTEAIEEGVNQFGGNALDRFVQGKNTPLMEGVPEAAVIGGVSGNLLGAGHAVRIASKTTIASNEAARALSDLLTNGEFSTTDVGVATTNPNISAQPTQSITSASSLDGAVAAFQTVTNTNAPEIIPGAPSASDPIQGSDTASLTNWVESDLAQQEQIDGVPNSIPPGADASIPLAGDAAGGDLAVGRSPDAGATVDAGGLPVDDMGQTAGGGTGVVDETLGYAKSGVFRTPAAANLYIKSNKLEGKVKLRDTANGIVIAPIARKETVGELRKQNTAIERLNRDIAASGESAQVERFTPDPQRDSVAVQQSFSLIGQANTLLNSAQIQPFVPIRGLGENGVAHAGSTFLDVEELAKPDSSGLTIEGLVLHAAGHEAMHPNESKQNEQDRADYRKVYFVVQQYRKEGILEKRTKLEDAASIRAGGKARGTAYAAREIVADVSGAMWRDSKFWGRVWDIDDGSTMRRVGYRMMQALAKVVEVSKGNKHYNIKNLVSNVDAVREAYAAAFAAKASRSGKMMSKSEAAKTLTAAPKTGTDNLPAYSRQTNFEVAPDPNDKDLSGQWNVLELKDKQEISHKVATDVIPKILAEHGIKGEIVEQVGSYGEDTNPSFALITESGDTHQLSKDAGHVLSQDSMMNVSDEPFAGSEKVGAVILNLGTKTFAEVKSIYDTLHKAVPEVGGQSYVKGNMIVLNYSDTSTDELAQKIDAALSSQYPVEVTELHSSFPEKSEYGYDNRSNDTGATSGTEGAVQGRYDGLRRQASDAIRAEISQRQGRPDSVHGARDSKTIPGAVHYSRQTNFEVAPDPNDKALSSDWNALPLEHKQQISREVADDIIPKVLAERGAKGTVSEQFGSYLDDTNPSFALTIEEGDLNQISKDVGHVLSQDSMMNISGEAFDGASKVEAVVVNLGAKSFDEVKAIYDTIRKAAPEVGGQSFTNGNMVVLNYSNTPIDKLAKKIDDALDSKYPVDTQDYFSSFPEKSEYGHDNNAENTREGSGTQSAVRSRYDDLRGEASRLIRAAIAKRQGRPDSVRGARDSKTVPGAVHYSNAAGLTKLSGSSSGTGIKGAEQERLNQPGTDHRIKKRAYFYLPTVDGIPQPKTGLGSNVYKADLTDLYDASTTDKPISGSGNALESAILDAGYKGYINHEQGTVVVLNSDVDVKAVGKASDHKQVQRKTQTVKPKVMTRTEKDELVRKPSDAEIIQLIRATPAVKTVAPSFRMQYGEARVHKDEAAHADLALKDAGADFQFGTPSYSRSVKEQDDTEVEDKPSQVDKKLKQFMGRSVIVFSDGTPIPMYHGTARDLDRFQPKQANAIFLTYSPEFADQFSATSAEWMVKHYKTELTTEQVTQATAAAVKDVMSDASQPMSRRKSLSTEIKAGDPKGEALDYLRPHVEMLMPSGPNIMPLIVRAETPFDYRKNRDVDDLMFTMKDRLGDDFSLDIIGFDKFETNADGVESMIRFGVWQVIESPEVQAAIKELGHDSFFVKENGQINLAVYESNQIKSAIGNNGNYDIKDDRIAYARKDIERVINAGAYSTSVTRLLNDKMPVDNLKVQEVGEVFDAAYTKEFGKRGDWNDAKDFKRAVRQATAEVKHQMEQSKSGLDWYDDDIRKAFDETQRFIPSLVEPKKRVLFSVFAGIMSPTTNARDNWNIAAEAFLHYESTGTIPGVNPRTGSLWQGGASSANKKKALEMLDAMVKDKGEDAAIDWLSTEHTIGEINAARGQYGGMGKMGGNGKLGDIRLGFEMFGPKVGPFVMNINGIHEVTVDIWITRTFNRYFGQMIDANGVMPYAPTEAMRVQAKQLAVDVGAAVGIKPYQVQSVLWLFEQSLFNKLGTGAQSYGFSDGAAKFTGIQGAASGTGASQSASDGRSDTGNADGETVRGSGENDRADRPANQRPKAEIAYARKAGPDERKYQHNYLVPEIDGFDGGNIAHLPAIMFAKDGIKREFKAMPVRMRVGEHQRDKKAERVSQYGLQHRIENRQENPQDRGYVTPDVQDEVERAARDITLGVLDAQTAYADNAPTKVYLHAPSLNRSTVLEIQTDSNGDKFWSVVTSMPSTREQMLRRYKAPTSVVGTTLNGERTQQAFDIKRGMIDKLKSPGQSPVTSESYIIEPDGLLFHKPKEAAAPVVAEKKQLARDANGRIILNKNKISHSRKYPGVAGNRFTLSGETKFSGTRRAMQDFFLPVLQAQEALLAKGGVVGELQDTYRAEERSYGRIEEAIKDFRNKTFVPMVEKATKAGINMDELALYAYAKHAPERNAYIATIDRKLQDGGSGMTNQEAADIEAAFNAEGKLAALEDLHNDLMAITTTTRREMLESDLITQDHYDAMESQFQNYIPLRGWEETDQIDVPIPRRGGRGYNIRGKETMKALGRTSRAGDLIENVVSDYERAITRGERNNVGKTFLELVRANPDPGLWEIDAEKTRKSFDRASGKVARNTVIDSGTDTVAIKLQGKEVYVKIKDARLLRAMRLAYKDDTGALAAALNKSIGLYSTLMRNTLTRFNPAFAATNLVRDYGMASVGVVDTLGYAGLAKFNKHYAGATRASWRNERGTQEADEWGKWFEEFRAAGATTGGFYARDAETITKDIRDIMLINGAAPKNFGEQLKANRAYALTKKLGHALEILGSTSENASRVAAYRTAREMGKTPAEAASIAKNLTTNFNRKGEWGQVINTGWVFFNASVQGSTRVIQALENPKVWGLLAGASAAGFMMAMANAANGGDDDDGQAYWDKIPDYEKERNFIIMLNPGMDIAGSSSVGKHGRYFKIPMPYGFNFFPMLGQNLADVYRHGKDETRGLTPAKAAANMVATVFASFNPFGGAIDIGNKDSVAMAVMPSLADFLYQQSQGINAFARPTAPVKGGYYTGLDSDNVNPRQAGGFAHKAARKLNEWTGGNESEAGYVDLAPGTLENLWRNATGGTGTFLTDVFVNLPTKLNTPEATITARDIPILKSFYAPVDEVNNAALFYERRKAINDAQAIQHNYEMNGQERKADPDFDALVPLASIASTYTKALSELRKSEIALAEDESLTRGERTLQINELKAERNTMITEFNTMFMEVMRNKRDLK